MYEDELSLNPYGSDDTMKRRLLYIFSVMFVIAFVLYKPSLWRNDFVGMKTVKAHSELGPPDCQHVDEDAWYAGASVQGFHVFGKALILTYGAEIETGSPVVVSQTVFPVVFGLFYPCSWEH